MELQLHIDKVSFFFRPRNSQLSGCALLEQVLKHENVSYIVAPYEADAQMTFLAVSKHVEAIITEDSDLIAFGCPRVSFHADMKLSCQLHLHLLFP